MSSRGKNMCIFIGNLGKDPELRSTQSGAQVANASLAVNESYKDKQTGELVEKVEWVSLVFWSKLAEIAAQYLKKGSRIYVEGSLRTRKWQDKEGRDRYSTEVHCNQMLMLDGKGQQAAETGGGASSSSAAPAEKQFEDDDIPFVTMESVW